MSGFEETTTKEVGTFDDHELGFDDVIEKESDFILLPPGDYEFVIADYERARHEGSEKLPPCGKLIVQLRIKYPQAPDGYVTMRHNLFFHTKTEGMLSTFLKSIGQKKKGEPTKVNWQTFTGSTGRCKIDVKKSKNGNDFNDIKKFYEKEQLTPQQAPAAGFQKGEF